MRNITTNAPTNTMPICPACGNKMWWDDSYTDCDIYDCETCESDYVVTDGNIESYRAWLCRHFGDRSSFARICKGGGE